MKKLSYVIVAILLVGLGIAVGVGIGVATVEPEVEVQTVTVVEDAVAGDPIWVEGFFQGVWAGCMNLAKDAKFCANYTQQGFDVKAHEDFADDAPIVPLLEKGSGGRQAPQAPQQSAPQRRGSMSLQNTIQM